MGHAQLSTRARRELRGIDRLEVEQELEEVAMVSAGPGRGAVMGRCKAAAASMREYKRRAERERRKRVQVHALRILRRLPVLDAGEALEAGEWLDRHRYDRGDALAFRGRPELFPGWREAHGRLLDYLLGDCAAGLPLAAEGGRPIRCADRVTSDLSCANHRAWRQAQGR